MKEKRLQKIKEFETFYDNSKTVFEELGKNDKRVEDFQREHKLCVCPGSRAGGNEKRIVEVFWGAKAYEFETRGKNWKSLSETGASLFFYRNDTGDVTISLNPAKTEYRQPIEDYIALHDWINPKKLNDQKFIKSLWDDFVAYMETTSLDGKPTYFQKLRIWYLRQFKHLVIKQTWTPTKFSEFIKRVTKTSTSVIFSGAVLIFLINRMTNPTVETENQLKEINKNFNKVLIQIENISKNNSNIKSISVTLDSIALKTNEIFKNIKKSKPKKPNP